MADLPSTANAGRRRPRTERPKAMASYRLVVWQEIRTDLVGALREIAESEGVPFSLEQGRRGSTITFGQRPNRRRSAGGLTPQQRQEFMKKVREALRKDPTRLISFVEDVAGSDVQSRD